MKKYSDKKEQITINLRRELCLCVLLLTFLVHPFHLLLDFDDIGKSLVFQSRGYALRVR